MLNLPPDDGVAPGQSARDGQALAAALKATVNAFKAAAMDENVQTVNYGQLRTSPAYSDYQTTLTPQLQTYDPAQPATRGAQLAFWINLYNALVIDAVISYAVRDSVVSQWGGLGFFRHAAYVIGGHRCSLEDMEHGILRANCGNPFLPGSQFAPDDSRLG